MHILRNAVLGAAALAFAGLLSGSLAAGGQSPTPAEPGKMPMSGKGMDGKGMEMTRSMTRDEKIANAISAAPASITAKATILDWPAKEGDAPVVLRAGSNGWSCLPDMPATDGNDPQCLDGPWMKWVEAYMAKTAPKISSVGIGYMIAPGGSHGSNSDPYAMAEMPGNHWAHHPPHLMIVVPDPKSLEGISTDPHNGGPYVMFKGTPYAHIMAPVSPAMKGAH